MTHRSAFICASLLAVALGCETKSEAPATSVSPATSASPAASSSLSTQAGSSGVQVALDALDPRAPVPLLPMMAIHQKQNMRDHLLAVQEIVSAMATKDFGAIEKSASRLGSSEQMLRMCNHMGAGAPGFAERALSFHQTADKIGHAARKHDSNAIITALSETLAVCTSCHAAFKQKVVADYP